MSALIGNDVGGPVFWMLVFLATGVVVFLARAPLREGRDRRNQRRHREKLRREFWGNE